MTKLIFLMALVLFASHGGQADTPLSRGERVFLQCANCHTIEQGAGHRYGPSLYGVLGRDIATWPDFDYSDAMLAETGVWTKKRLSAFLIRPRRAIDGTHMSFRGILSPHDREDLIAWIANVQAGRRSAQDPTLVPDFLNRGDAARGHDLFRPCTVCHTSAPGEAAKIGPNLYGVMGREIAGNPGFPYSERLLRRRGTWTPETLNIFLFEAKAFDQGSHQAFQSLHQLTDRADMIAWLREISPDYVPGEKDLWAKN